jgi:hypothetical protein
MRRRFFQRFQERIKAVTRQHVHFVNKINFETAARGGVLHVIKQIACIFYFGARSGINFNEIDKAALLNLTAVYRTDHMAWR